MTGRLRECKKRVRTGNSLEEVVISENQCRVLDESECLDTDGVPLKTSKCINVNLAMKELINVFVDRFNLYNERLGECHTEIEKLQIAVLDAAEGGEIPDIAIGTTHTRRLTGL